MNASKLNRGLLRSSWVAKCKEFTCNRHGTIIVGMSVLMAAAIAGVLENHGIIKLQPPTSAIDIDRETP